MNIERFKNLRIGQGIVLCRGRETLIYGFGIYWFNHDAYHYDIDSAFHCIFFRKKFDDNCCERSSIFKEKRYQKYDYFRRIHLSDLPNLELPPEITL